MIRNIIFDFGGIIYDVRYENVNDALVALGATHLNNFYSKQGQTHAMDLLEQGLMSVADFHDYMRQLAKLPLSDSQIDHAINAVMLCVPPKRVDTLLRLRGLEAHNGNVVQCSEPRYRTFLFSNTNLICYNYFRPHLREQYGFDIFDHCFERAYFSQFMHTKKPSAEGFKTILNDNGLRADETLFIDDIAANAAAATRIGIHGLHLPEADISTLFTPDGWLKETIAI